jgi:hypothetical protein
MDPIPFTSPPRINCGTMSQSASREDEHFSAAPSVKRENGGSLQGSSRRGQNQGALAPPGSSTHVSAISPRETPFGAIHVDASGVVLEHRPLEAGDASVQPELIVGHELKSIAAWANEPAFVSALKSAIDSARVSFHFDFKTATGPRERVVHVNILAVGDKTAWIFISDKTLAMIS